MLLRNKVGTDIFLSQTGILRFKMEICVYKWSQLVLMIIIIIFINSISLPITQYKMSRVRTTVSVDQFFAFFDALELNYTLTYAPHEVRNLGRLPT